MIKLEKLIGTAVKFDGNKAFLAEVPLEARKFVLLVKKLKLVS